jgi:hypothetical protein
LGGVTSTIGCFASSLSSLESPVGRGMLCPGGTASSGVLLPEGVLLREVGGVLKHLGGPLVHIRRVLGYLECAFGWGFRYQRPASSRYWH